MANQPKANQTQWRQIISTPVKDNQKQRTCRKEREKNWPEMIGWKRCTMAEAEKHTQLKNTSMTCSAPSICTPRHHHAQFFSVILLSPQRPRQFMPTPTKIIKMQRCFEYHGEVLDRSCRFQWNGNLAQHIHQYEIPNSCPNNRRWNQCTIAKAGQHTQLENSFSARSESIHLSIRRLIDQLSTLSGYTRYIPDTTSLSKGVPNIWPDTIWWR